MVEEDITSLKDLRDSELVRRCRTGLAEAFDVLVQRHQEKIFNAVLRFCGNWDNASDITQRAFINAFRKIKDFKGESAFSTWMYRIAFNQSVSFRREQSRQRSTSLYSGPDNEMSVEPAVDAAPTEKLESDDDRRLVHKALQELEEQDRRIIVLKDLNDCSYDDIASILEVPKGTVRSRLHRARMELKEKLKAFMGTRPGEKASK